MENFDELIQSLGQQPTTAPSSDDITSVNPSSKDEYAAKMKAERDTLSELAKSVETEIVGDGNLFQQYLNTLARFERYSTQNTLLIYAQCPEAVKVGDYDYWKAEGTPVSRGETGIKIFEPGKEFLKGDKTIGTSMNIKRVFDISQTAARNKYQQPVNKPDIRTLLKALMSKSPAPIKLVDSVADGNGAQYNENTGVIEVGRCLDGESLFRCLSQEITYAGLEQQNPNCRSNAFNAYATSYALCIQNDIDARGYDFTDAPEVFAGKEGKEVRGVMKEIRDSVNGAATRMADALEPQQKEVRSQEARA